jgi:hypothetical protein
MGRLDGRDLHEADRGGGHVDDDRLHAAMQQVGLVPEAGAARVAQAQLRRHAAVGH